MEFDWTTFALEIINFLVLVWILQRFLYKPVTSAIAERKAGIEKTLADAQAVQAEAESLKRQYENRMANWEHEKAQARVQLLQEMDAERTPSDDGAARLPGAGTRKASRAGTAARRGGAAQAGGECARRGRAVCGAPAVAHRQPRTGGTHTRTAAGGSAAFGRPGAAVPACSLPGGRREDEHHQRLPAGRGAARRPWRRL